MYNAEEPRKQIRLANYHDDVPNHSAGFLIPANYGGRTAATKPTSKSYTLLSLTFVHKRAVMFTVTALLMFSITFGTAAHWVTKGAATMAAPIVVVTSEDLPEPKPLHYGVQALLSQPNFFAETQASFIQEKLTFVEADLSQMRLRYFNEGQEVFSVPILSKGKEGSWWETPAGLYEIELKKEKHFSSFGNVYQPWNMVFQGNFFIHGWPQYPDGTPVPEGFSGGCIRLSDENAKALYELVAEGTPVLVHEADFQSDNFVYEARVPELTAPQYLLADIKSNAILASDGLDTVVPIASLTKIMTALVAAEYINLDKDVYLVQEQYVTTLIPRLEGRQTASMYSLLQLLLIESSNEAAEVIAAQVGRERFIQVMNEKALALGLEHTTFTDPSGLDDGNISTVSDLLRLVQYIHFNRNFILELTHNQNLLTAYKSGEFGVLENFNLIEGIDNFIGGKVGETAAAGQTSASLHAVTIDGQERILALIILGSSSRSEDINTLMSYVTELFIE